MTHGTANRSRTRRACHRVLDPLGPESSTWKYFGDWRGLLQGLWAGSMQNMHPGLGAAVEQHSEFFTEGWKRLFRSLYPIGVVVYDGDRAPSTGAQIRHFHDRISGVDAQGRRCHALDPDTFYWAHATFFVGMLRTAEHFIGPLGDDEKRRLFDEHVTWYRMYGMSMRPSPRVGTTSSATGITCATPSSRTTRRPRRSRSAQPGRPAAHAVAARICVARRSDSAHPQCGLADCRALRSAGSRTARTTAQPATAGPQGPAAALQPAPCDRAGTRREMSVGPLG
ncbi:hypothetical protein Rrhod_3223 [Rhodococcus rhodnii LMG 5362]|uniref:ER-bound oxygenase mpaB/mpaB'/Rubber oxygenase catalytic domain-containing protein n=1 Tax=Rhodococcus rhodnii LMG 5362 TaxID=1273125 RepID=R7WJH9_9NOCA|nr:hypothetical protein Rrhod_3223 [Rhodococcus rhodnii LMG 5362]